MTEKKLIVKTPGTLSGRPRIDGHRIAVSDVWLAYLRALEDLAVPMILRDYPHLTEEEVREALHYAYTHMKEIEQEIEEDLQAAREAGVEPY